jgi:VanZ family protein
MNRRAGLAIGWAWVAAVIYLSLAPALPSSGVEGGDKIAHFLSYGVMTYWFAQFYFHRARIFYALGFVAMGVALEFAQRATGYRSFELADMAANALGVAAGWACAALLPRLRPKA